jgi:hypothetical protein
MRPREIRGIVSKKLSRAGIVLRHISIYFPGALALLISAWAVGRGGRNERLVAALLMTFWFLTPLLHHQYYGSPNLGAVAVDVLALVAFTLLSLQTRQLWILFMAAFELDTIACHVVKAIYPGISQYAYLTGTVIWGGYAQLACLLAGMISYESRRQTASLPARNGL